jgi:hypothetical protein
MEKLSKRITRTQSGVIEKKSYINQLTEAHVEGKKRELHVNNHPIAKSTKRRRLVKKKADDSDDDEDDDYDTDNDSTDSDINLDQHREGDENEEDDDESTYADAMKLAIDNLKQIGKLACKTANILARALDIKHARQPAPDDVPDDDVDEEDDMEEIPFDCGDVVPMQLESANVKPQVRDRFPEIDWRYYLGPAKRYYDGPGNSAAFRCEAAFILAVQYVNTYHEFFESEFYIGGVRHVIDQITVSFREDFARAMRVILHSSAYNMAVLPRKRDVGEKCKCQVCGRTKVCDNFIDVYLYDTRIARWAVGNDCCKKIKELALLFHIIRLAISQYGKLEIREIVHSIAGGFSIFEHKRYTIEEFYNHFDKAFVNMGSAQHAIAEKYAKISGNQE